jgi:hypothetical protein
MFIFIGTTITKFISYKYNIHRDNKLQNERLALKLYPLYSTKQGTQSQIMLFDVLNKGIFEIHQGSIVLREGMTI